MVAVALEVVTDVPAPVRRARFPKLSFDTAAVRRPVSGPAGLRALPALFFETIQ